VRAKLARAGLALAENPHMGRVGQLQGTREFVVRRTPYILVYRVAEDTIEVLRIMHGAQQWPPREG